jgi:hypothetical protein
MAKNGQVYEARAGRAVGRSSANSTKLFSIDSHDLNSMSFKFGDNILITFEMPRSSYKMIFWKITFRCCSVHLLSDVLAVVATPG